MQQLTTQSLTEALSLSDNGQLMINLPLPATPLAFTRLCEGLGKVFDQPPTELEWGADRAQARYLLPDMDLLLQAEWLCEAMWLTPSGYTQDSQNATEALQALLCRVANE